MNPFGVCIQPPTAQQGQLPDLIAQAGAAGFGLVRLCVYWDAIEKRPGVLHWEALDAQVEAAEAARLIPVGQIAFTPLWASSAPVGWLSRTRYPAKDPADWRRYCQTGAERYRGRIAAWEVWNEPDLAFWKGTAVQYAEMLSGAAAGLRAGDPGATLLAGAFAHAVAACRDTGLLKKALAQLHTWPFDGITFHDYSPDPRVIAKGLTALRGLVGDVPIWLTETGQPSDPAKARDPRYAGLDGQARWLREVFLHLPEIGLEKVFWYQLIDNPSQGVFATQGLLGKPALAEIMAQ